MKKFGTKRIFGKKGDFNKIVKAVNGKAAIYEAYEFDQLNNNNNMAKVV